MQNGHNGFYTCHFDELLVAELNIEFSLKFNY